MFFMQNAYISFSIVFDLLNYLVFETEKCDEMIYPALRVSRWTKIQVNVIQITTKNYVRIGLFQMITVVMIMSPTKITFDAISAIFRTKWKIFCPISVYQGYIAT